ncbi:MAG: cell division protein FtsZ, partial [Verrucomicrobiae bacterium]|nr:cell division protein FtsZ [Verrucomicrobiae bacterium]
ERHVKIKVVGVGGAGSNAVDRLVMEGFDTVDILCVNTDSQHLVASVAPQKIQIGAQRTRGLGAGGNPQVGMEAAIEDEMELRSALTGYDLVFLAAGMGGGTGTGAGPVLARIAKEQGALVLALVTTPFTSEGKHRCRVAAQGLEEMRQSADAVICISNDRLLSIAESETSVLDAFRPTDQFLCEGVKMIYSMLAKTGLINIDFADLTFVLRRERGETLFGFGSGRGDRKIAKAVDAALRSPLLSQDDILGRAEAALVCMTYGPSMTMREVNEGMKTLQDRFGDNTAVKVGYVIDEMCNDEVCIVVIASTGKTLKTQAPRKTTARIAAPDKKTGAPSREVALEPVLELPRNKPQPQTQTPPRRVARKAEPEPVLEIEPETESESEPLVDEVELDATELADEGVGTREHAELEVEPPYEEEPEPTPAPVSVRSRQAAVPQKEIFLGMKPGQNGGAPAPSGSAADRREAARKAAVARQVNLPLDESTHGIFSKHDRTIVNGQDLDQPTYLRAGRKLLKMYKPTA